MQGNFYTPLSFSKVAYYLPFVAATAKNRAYILGKITSFSILTLAGKNISLFGAIYLVNFLEIKRGKLVIEPKKVSRALYLQEGELTDLIESGLLRMDGRNITKDSCVSFYLNGNARVGNLLNEDLKAGNIPGVNKINYKGIKPIVETANDQAREVIAMELIRTYGFPRGSFSWIVNSFDIKKVRRGVYLVTPEIDRFLRRKYSSQ